MQRSTTAIFLAGGMGLALAVATGETQGQNRPAPPQSTPPATQSPSAPPGQTPASPPQQTPPQNPPAQPAQPGQQSPGQQQPAQPNAPPHRPRPMPPDRGSPPANDVPDRPNDQPNNNPNRATPATPGTQPGQPATPATPSDNASNRAGQTPSRTGGTPSRQPDQNQNPQTNPMQPANPAQPTNPGQPAAGTPGGPNVGTTANPTTASPQDMQAAQAVTKSLLNLNPQNVNAQGTIVVSDVLNNAQISVLAHAFQTNSQLQSAATALTQRLRQNGQISANQEVVGFQNGRFVISNGPLAAAGATTSASVSPADMQRNLQSAQAMVNALPGLNVQNANIQGVVNASGTMDNAQINALIQALNNNPQARMAADALTQRLQREGKIGASDRVVGFQDGKVIVMSGPVSLGSPTSGNPVPNVGGANPGTSAGASQVSSDTLLNNLATLNTQNVAVQNIADLNTVMNQSQTSVFLKALDANNQALQNSQELTRRLRADGRIGPQQRVVAFQDGRVFVTGGGIK